MPAVNLNRIYMLRAHGRRPILNGVNVPDAAGAYQRATMPALRTRLAISENDARIKQDDIHRKYQGIATGIRAFGNALDTTSRYMEQREREMERAQARQSASTRMEVENRYRQYMLDHAQEIYETPYGRETDGAGNLKITGPFSKALEVHNGFWDNDSKAAELRETLGEDDRARLEQEYTNWGFALQSDSAKKQSELNQQYMLKNWKDRGNTLKGEIANSLERGDVDAWKRSMMEYVEFAGEGAEIELGIRDLGGGLKRPPTEQQAATISDVKRATAETLAMERIEFLHRAYIMDGDADTLAEIQAWGAEKALSDAGRLHARELAADAQEKWTAREERRMAEEDKAAMEGAKMGVLDALKAAGDAPLDTARISALRETPFHDKAKSDALNAWIDSNIADANDAGIIRQLGEKLGLQEAPAEGPFAQEREAAKNIQDPKKREAAIAVIDSVEAGREFESWDADYERAVEQLEQLEGFSEGTIRIQQEAIANVVDAIGDLRTEAAREMAMKRVAGVQGELGKFYSQMAIDVLNQGWYLGRDGKPHSLSDREAIDIYSRFIPYMTREQKDAVHAAYAKQRVQLAPQDFTGLEDWLAQKGIPLQNLYSWTDMARTGKVEVNSELFSHAIPDMEGFADDYTQNEGLAREIWAAVEQFKRMQTTLQGKDSAGKAMTLRQYLDGYFDQNRNLLDAWKDSRTVRRVAETRRIFDQLEAEMFYGPFSEPERPIEEDE